VVIALATGTAATAEVILLIVAGLVAVATFAPTLPILHRLPLVGAPRVTVYINQEQIPHVPTDVVLRVGFKNDGPKRVTAVLGNVLVPLPIEIRPSDFAGELQDRGSRMPPTELDGRPTRFWAEKDVNLPKGATLLHYRLTIPEPGDYPVQITYSSDDLSGKGDAVANGRADGTTLPKGFIELRTLDGTTEWVNAAEIARVEENAD
jgi:hypothetical protein